MSFTFGLQDLFSGESLKKMIIIKVKTLMKHHIYKVYYL